jgi:succinyl-CoA synthetase alpha subunit
VVEAKSKAIGEGALTKAETLLSDGGKDIVKNNKERLPQSFSQAYKVFQNANMLFVSVPGPYAALEAAKALNVNMNVMLFSDNVSLKDELKLKMIAKQKGLLLMGPGCGTAIINGIALGFANVLDRGPVGIVGASGTGIQEFTTLINRMGVGVSQVIGVGGRDLTDTIGGIMMIQGINMLASDSSTELIVLISKPPSIKVIPKIMEEAQASRKPVVINFLGWKPSKKLKNLYFTETIEDTAETVLSIIKKSTDPFFVTKASALLGMAYKERARFSKNQKYIRGLFSGGSLCDEAIDVFRRYSLEIYSNVETSKKWTLKNSQVSKHHSCIDMGEEEFTQSRPHPMIDLSLRQERIQKEANDSSVAVILIDVVIGYGSHDNPAAGLADTIQKAKENAINNNRYLSVVAHVCGSNNDHQGLKIQEEYLHNVGVLVLPTNAQAAKVAAAIVGAELK